MAHCLSLGMSEAHHEQMVQNGNGGGREGEP